MPFNSVKPYPSDKTYVDSNEVAKEENNVLFNRLS